MNASRQRALNIWAGMTFSLLGLACYGAAGYLTEVPRKPVMGINSLELNTKPCEQMLSRLGFQVSKFKTELRVEKKGGLENAERLLADASIGISSCGLPLVRFCVGTGCEAPATPDGIFFALGTHLSTSDVLK